MSADCVFDYCETKTYWYDICVLRCCWYFSLYSNYYFIYIFFCLTSVWKLIYFISICCCWWFFISFLNWSFFVYLKINRDAHFIRFPLRRILLCMNRFTHKHFFNTNWKTKAIRESQTWVFGVLCDFYEGKDYKLINEHIVCVCAARS